MKAITNELHKALLMNLAQLPMGQVEQLVVGLRGALDLPQPIAEDLQRGAQAKHAAALRAQLTELNKAAPPSKEPPPQSNGKDDHAEADQPSAE